MRNDHSTASVDEFNEKRGAEEDSGHGNEKRQRPLLLTTAYSSRSSQLTMAFSNGSIRITCTPGRKNDKNCVNLGVIMHTKSILSPLVSTHSSSQETSCSRTFPSRILPPLWL